MIKIEAKTLEEAYQNAASSLSCSVTELRIEVIQSPSAGILGLFKKSAIIVATKEQSEPIQKDEIVTKTFTNDKKIEKKEVEKVKEVEKAKEEKPKKAKKQKIKEKVIEEADSHTILNDTIMPQSFVSMQDDEDEDDSTLYLADYDDEEDENEEHEPEVISEDMKNIASSVQNDINELFDFTCFNIDTIDVKVYDANTLLIEFKGDDAALLIGKEGYRYKALSYMIFNWINSKYQVQLRLEIAEFLKNQEESVSRYLATVYENVERDGRAQTKILDGVLVQIALRELRDRYHDKYVAIRSTRDGLKYIIINDYHSN